MIHLYSSTARKNASQSVSRSQDYNIAASHFEFLKIIRSKELVNFQEKAERFQDTLGKPGVKKRESPRKTRIAGKSYSKLINLMQGVVGNLHYCSLSNANH